MQNIYSSSNLSSNIDLANADFDDYNDERSVNNNNVGQKEDDQNGHLLDAGNGEQIEVIDRMLYKVIDGRAL